MGTLGNRDCQRASRSTLKDFTEDALTISTRMVKANWRKECTASLLVELECVATKPLAGWNDEG